MGNHYVRSLSAPAFLLSLCFYTLSHSLIPFSSFFTSILLSLSTRLIIFDEAYFL